MTLSSDHKQGAMSGGDHDDRRRAIEELRALVHRCVGDVRAAERSYDIPQAVQHLEELAAPLTAPLAAEQTGLYLDVFYRDIVEFVLGFVAVNLEGGFSKNQRDRAFDVFFDPAHVPALKSVDALIARLTRSPPSSGEVRQEHRVTINHSVRLLKWVLDGGGMKGLFRQLLSVERVQGQWRAAVITQTVVNAMCSLPDLVYNRLQRSTPQFFSPRPYIASICQNLLDTCMENTPQDPPDVMITGFRQFVTKFIRIGKHEELFRSWIGRADLFDPGCENKHVSLLQSLPASAILPFLTFFASSPNPANTFLNTPSYRLLSLIPKQIVASDQFTVCLAHKVLLSKPVRDIFVIRVITDLLALQTHGDHNPRANPLCEVFDIVITRWSGDEFPVTTDYELNTSVSLFLRYAITQIAATSHLVQPDWTTKLCRGVQAHLAHSSERVRELGMRVGETMSQLISPDNPLNFNIDTPDPLQELLNRQINFNEFEVVDDLCRVIEPDMFDRHMKETTGSTSTCIPPTESAVIFDPDAEFDSEDEDSPAVDAPDDLYDSDSDTSLVAFDLHDEEEDLMPARPVYIKDLIAGLLAENEHDKTETALAEAEALIRRKPRDLHYHAKDIVVALLRLEDRYNTPDFTTLRDGALSATCVLSPADAVPYLQAQALEREQLFQSRLDVLHALVSAAQELSETGSFARSGEKKALLKEGIDTRAMQELKTRRWGYRRNPLARSTKNAFADHALGFFSPLLFGYLELVRRAREEKRHHSELDDLFLAHLLHALASFVECAGSAPPAIPMAKALLEFSWHQRKNFVPAVRRQVLFAISRVLLVMPPFLLRQDLADELSSMASWLREVKDTDPDDGCREASRILLSSAALPMLAM